MPISDETLENVGTGLFGQAMNLAFGGLYNKRQRNQQKKLGEIQLEQQKRMSMFQKDLDMQMWHDTNYEAQVEHAKNAGLSISHLMGKGGAGGATTGGGGMGIGSASAEGASQGTMAGMAMASQLALQKAQKENIEADTENKKAGAGKATEETEGQKIENTVKGTPQAIADQQKQLTADAELQMQRVGEQTTNTEIGRKTTNERIGQIKAEYAGQILENALTKAETTHKYADVKRIHEETKAIEERIKQGWKGLSIQEFSETMKANYPTIWEVLGKQGNDAVESLYKIGNFTTKGTQQPTHYKPK